MKFLNQLNQFLSDFNSLYECGVLNEKALWQATEANKKTKLTEFLSVMGNFLSIFAFVFNQIF